MKSTMRRAAPLALVTLALSTLSGCFVFIDDHDDDRDYDYEDERAPPPPINHVPEFDVGDSWWACDWSENRGDYFFEFQAVVDDFDGPGDVAFVDATVFLADDPDFMVDTVGLLHESGPVWGGIVWEAESNLYCGEPIDVLFEAWDSAGDKAELLIRY